MAKKLLIILLLFVSPSFGQHSLSVAGIVTDHLGNPVAGATVMMPQSACNGCVDNPQIAYKTNYEGAFFLTSEISGKKARFLIEGPVPDDLWNPVAPVDHTLRRVKAFAGRYLDAERGSIQLEEVHPDIVYSQVTVDLISLFASKRKLLDDIQRIRIRLAFGHVLVERGVEVHERAIDRTRKRLIFALPNGDWRMTIILYTNEQKASRTINLSVPQRSVRTKTN